MKKLIMYGSILFLVAAAGPAKAQRLEQQFNQGLQVATFDLKQGKKTLYLPGKISGGDVICGRVIDEPSGKNDTQRQKNSSILQGYVVEVEQVDNEQGNGFLKATIPAAIGGSMAYIALKDGAGRTLSRVPFTVEPAIPKVPVAFTPMPADISIPQVVQAGSPATICGHFDGDLSNTHIRIDDKPALILAESPDAVVIESPEGVSGPVNIVLHEAGEVYFGRTNIVDISLTADNLRLNRGQQARIALTLVGVPEQGAPVRTEVTNLTPDKVLLQGGNTQQFDVYPNVTGTTHVQDFTVTAVQVGSFAIQATILDQTPPMVLMLYPANGVEVEPGQVDFIWRSADLPSGASYTFRLWRDEQLVHQATVTGNRYTLPQYVTSRLPEDQVPMRWELTPQGNVVFDLRGNGDFLVADAKPMCKCVSISVRVRVTNQNTGRSSSKEANVPVRSGTHRIIMPDADNGFSVRNGDNIRIEISGVNVKCTCEDNACKTEGTQRADANRGATIELGENDHDSSSDNYNFRRTQSADNGWSNGTFTVNGLVIERAENPNVTSVYQCFVVKAWCSHENCMGRKYCHKKFTIWMGNI